VSSGQEETPGAARVGYGERAVTALSAKRNWFQLAKFCSVGASGYVVNLAVYYLLWRKAGQSVYLAATGSFIVAATSNYLWNRFWTFRDQRSHFALQGMRFFAVSALAYGANLGLLWVGLKVGFGEFSAQACAIVLVTPVNFLGNKLWSFRK
jgi:putative flippase GtrA